jgi:hypothetical protein
MVLGKNRFDKNDCLKKVKQNLNKQMWNRCSFCIEFIYLRKKIAMFTSELYQKLKDRLAALRRSL